MLFVEILLVQVRHSPSGRTQGGSSQALSRTADSRDCWINRLGSAGGHAGVSLYWTSGLSFCPGCFSFHFEGKTTCQSKPESPAGCKDLKGQSFFFCFLEILWRNAELSPCLERGNIMWWLSSCEAEAPQFETRICHLLAMWCWISARTSVGLEYSPLNCKILLILKETPSKANLHT